MAPAPHPSRRRTSAPPLVRTIAAPRPQRVLPWLLAMLLGACLASGLFAQVAINTTGQPPKGHALLDISSTNKGLLAPRMTSNQRMNLSNTAPAPAASTLDGLLVYQTDSTGTTPRGYYYYDNSTPIPGWRHIAWGPKLWVLGGNAGTTSADFLGTLNAMPLVFTTSNYEHGRITPTGELQLYVVNPPATATELVEVEGGVKLNGGSNGDNEGTIRFTPGMGNTRGKFEGYVVNSGAANATGWYQIDNNFGERKIQESPIPGVGCADPTNTSPVPGSVGSGDRPWPIPGPTAGPYGALNGPQSPYYTVWEDGHRQYLYRAADLAVAGICPGPDNPIRAIAFNATGVGSGNGRIHFLRISMKNTATNTAAAFDMAGLTIFSMPNYSPAYAAGHLTGYTVTTGWNVHAWDQSPTPTFYWSAGANLLIDASLDNQEWTGPSIRSGSVQSYNTSYTSMISMYCDACGGTGNHTCFWQPPPPTNPTNGVQGPPGSTIEGWGWTGGWNLVGGVDTRACDGSATDWQGGGPPSTASQLPRVAFLCKYTGGGAAYNVGSYMYAQDGVMIGDATWAASGTYPNTRFRGPGTISAQRSVWSDASLLSDYVFDLYYDGQAKPEDAKGAAGYARLPLKDLPNYVERERHLPTVDGRDTWNKTGAFSVDKLGNQLWVTVEDQALYIQELNNRMDALQQFLVEKKLKALGEATEERKKGK